MALLTALSSLVAAPASALAGVYLDRAASTAGVTIKGYKFAPNPFTVHVGDTVRWTNLDTAPHDVTSTSAPQILQSPTLHTGESWSFTFAVPGTYSYICSIHPDMQATVTALPAPSTPATTISTQPRSSPTSMSMPGMSALQGGPPMDSSTTSTSMAPAADGGIASEQSTPPNGSPGAGEALPAPAAASASSSTPNTHVRPFLWVAALVAGIVITALLLVMNPTSTTDAPRAASTPSDEEG